MFRFTGNALLLAGVSLSLGDGLMAQPAVISSVSPNPVVAGTFTVTITGTGIMPGATVLQGSVQLSTVGTPTATSVKSVMTDAAGVLRLTF
jgi:hypothetical protein